MNILGRKVKASSFFKGDLAIWMMMLLLCLISILVIYSSTASMAYSVRDGNTSYFLTRHIMVIAVSVGIAMIVQFINFKFYYRFAKLIFYTSLAALILTFFNGATFNDESRWIMVFGLTFQPSDFVKITLVMLLSKELAKRQVIMDNIRIIPPFWIKKEKQNKKQNLEILRKVTIPILLPIAISVVVIMISNLSTALLVAFTAFVLMIIGRVRIKELLRLIVLATGLLFLIVGIMFISGKGRVDTWVSRIESFVSGTDVESVDPNDMDEQTFQKYQAQIAVASGGITGVGPGNSTQRSSLPHSYSDYVYAFITEEYGSIGALIVLLLYFSIFYRAMIVLKRCKTAFPALLIIGLSFTIAIQAMLHMMVSANVGPVTGQTLPLISWGGSSILSTCIAIGMIQGVIRRVKEVEKMDEIVDKRHLMLEEWDQVELVEGEIQTEIEPVLLSEEEEIDEFEGITDPQEVDGLLQNDRLSKALDAEKYQPVIMWEDKKNKDNEDNI
ncbi:MAG: FtsW/RodA/SpoVE family cell cycle protein [Rikenellaceae bacterium]